MGAVDAAPAPLGGLDGLLRPPQLICKTGPLREARASRQDPNARASTRARPRQGAQWDTAPLYGSSPGPPTDSFRKQP